MQHVNDLPPSTFLILQQIRLSGSLTEAARASGISQPAVSKAIAKAEAAIGLSLVRRDQRPVCLTAEGELLAEYGERQNEMMLSLARRLEDRRVKGLGIVRIASFGPSASTRILPGLIAEVVRRRPLMHVEVLESADQPSLQALRDGAVDFAVLLADDAADLDMIPLAKDRLVALVRQDDAFANSASIDAKALAERDFIMTKGGSEALIRSWFARTGHQPRVCHGIQQITSILAMVRAGMGVSVIAEMAVPETHAGIATVPLKPEQPRNICLARKPGGFSSRAAELMWNDVKGRFQ